jgi:hypothetical protein
VQDDSNDYAETSEILLSDTSKERNLRLVLGKIAFEKS